MDIASLVRPGPRMPINTRCVECPRCERESCVCGVNLTNLGVAEFGRFEGNVSRCRPNAADRFQLLWRRGSCPGLS